MTVFIINLKSRTDRRKHILQQFKEKEDFEFYFVEACQHRNGAMGLWKSITNILQNLINIISEYVIICEDDHEFTTHYSSDVLYKCIDEAQAKDADILSGGVSWFKDAIQVSKDLFWVEKFSGLQFTIVFKKFYEKILSATFSESDAADYKISSLSDSKFVIYPFISTQKEFGYSDATSKNNEAGRVERIFDECSKRLQLLSNVTEFYKTI